MTLHNKSNHNHYIAIDTYDQETYSHIVSYMPQIKLFVVEKIYEKKKIYIYI